MQSSVTAVTLSSEAEWEALINSIPRGQDSSAVKGIFGAFRSVGAIGALRESSYIDRDFSAAYAAFYASLFEPYLKYCQRLHFFGTDPAALLISGKPEETAIAVEGAEPHYLGFVVVRPVVHAPVGAAVLSAARFSEPAEIEVSVEAVYTTHVAGAQLRVNGVPLTAQDTRVGACAQSAIWTIGRHFTRKHGGPWFSLPEITELALRPTDFTVSQSLPQGSEYLTADNMVRALRSMDRHPVIYARSDLKDPKSWTLSPVELIYRYLDSGIPVIVGLAPTGDSSIGHAVVAVGHTLAKVDPATVKENPTVAEAVDSILVVDDQRGLYCRLPKANEDKNYPWTIADGCQYLIVPLPSKVFIKADVAETLARDYVAQVIEKRIAICENGGLDTGQLSPVPAELLEAIEQKKLVARTYLTFGWKYKQRAIRNTIPTELKAEIQNKQFPRFVWVTEFGLAREMLEIDPCARRARAHVVIDATAYARSDSVLVVDTPGLAVVWDPTPTQNSPVWPLVARQTPANEGYYCKVRGERDYTACKARGA